MQFEKDFAESKANDDSDRREFINPKSKDFNSFQMRGNPLYELNLYSYSLVVLFLT